MIKNITAQKIRRVDVVFGLSYSDDIPKADLNPIRSGEIADALHGSLLAKIL